MKTSLTILALLATMTFFAIGCNDTAQGAAEDTKENAQAVGNAAEEVGEAVEEGAEEVAEAADNAVDAAKLTPQIKTAIIADPFLNEDGNVIDVDTTDEFVYLKGHVKTAELKARAEETAMKILKENKATQTVKNELEIKA